jgi:hypothetical protein
MVDIRALNWIQDMMMIDLLLEHEQERLIA